MSNNSVNFHKDLFSNCWVNLASKQAETELKRNRFAELKMTVFCDILYNEELTVAAGSDAGSRCAVSSLIPRTDLSRGTIHPAQRSPRWPPLYEPSQRVHGNELAPGRQRTAHVVVDVRRTRRRLLIGRRTGNNRSTIDIGLRDRTGEHSALISGRISAARIRR